jgi:hypothetical protein
MKEEGWWIDGVRLDTHGTILEDRNGWDDIPAMRGSNTTLLGRHGTAWRRKRYDEAKKVLTISVNGVGEDGWSIPETGREQRALYETNLDILLRLLSPRHRPLRVERVHANGDRRQADCEVTSILTPNTFGDTYGQISLELGVPGAFWEDVDPTSYRLAYDATTGGTQVMEVYSLVGSNAPCADPIVAITGPCTSVAVHDTETGSGFTYAHALTSGQVLTVDAGAFTALKGATSVLVDLAMADQQILEIVPAPSSYRGPSVTVVAAGTSAPFSVVFETRRKWLR